MKKRDLRSYPVYGRNKSGICACVRHAAEAYQSCWTLRYAG